MLFDNLNPGGQFKPNPFRKTAHDIFGPRIRWDDLGDAKAKIAELEGKIATAGDWKASLSDEVKAYPGLTKFATPQDAIVSYIELEKTLGKNKVTLLGDNPTAAEVATFYNKLGRPEKADGYQLADKIEGVPDDLPKNEVMMKGFLETAHSAGLSQKQTAALHEWYMKGSAAELDAYNRERDTARNNAETSLRTKWGKGYDAKVALAKKVIESFAGKDAKKFLEEGEGNNPILVGMLAEIGSKLSEDVLGEGAGRRLLLSAEQAKVELDAIMAGDSKSAYYNNEHPEHKAMVDKVTNLNQIIHPEATE